jgi:hypothetical protein
MLPPPLQLGITVTAYLCITAAHCRQSTNLSGGPPRKYSAVTIRQEDGWDTKSVFLQVVAERKIPVLFGNRTKPVHPISGHFTDDGSCLIFVELNFTKKYVYTYLLLISPNNQTSVTQYIKIQWLFSLPNTNRAQ